MLVEDPAWLKIASLSRELFQGIANYAAAAG